MSNPKWEIGPVKLANGETAFIEAINDEKDDYRYVGRVMVGSSWMPAGWHACGRMMYAVRDSGNNLAPPPKKKVRVRASILVYLDGSTTYYKTHETISGEAEKHAFAMVEIDREVEEGEGL